MDIHFFFTDTECIAYEYFVGTHTKNTWIRFLSIEAIANMKWLEKRPILKNENT